MEVGYLNKIKIMVEESQKKKQTELAAINHRMKKHVANVIAEHNKDWDRLGDSVDKLKEKVTSHFLVSSTGHKIP